MDFSNHARRRMLERGITQEEAEAVVADPHYTYPGLDKTVTCYVGEKFVVAVGTNNVVLTVHPREGTGEPYRPLR